MRRRIGCLALGMLLAFLKTAVGVRAAETFGAGVSLTSVTPIAQVLSRPADFEGKTVRVEGVVTEVCTQMGCSTSGCEAGDGSR